MTAKKLHKQTGAQSGSPSRAQRCVRHCTACRPGQRIGRQWLTKEVAAVAFASREAPSPQRVPGSSAVQVQGISKHYKQGDEPVHVLGGLDLVVPSGSFEALMGPSGSGKTTLLNSIAGLDRPTSGNVEVAGRRIDSLSDRALAKWRASTIGFVFQSYNLLPVLTALENVELPLLLRRCPSRRRRRRANRAPGPWASRIGRRTCRVSSREGNSSAWPSRAPSSATRR